jgi:ribose transport system substrate-binding protein
LTAARIQGQLDGLAAVIGKIEAGRVQRIDSGNTSAVSQAHARGALAEVPAGSRVAAICFNDDAALGALAAARSLGRDADIVAVGQGADRLAREELRRPGARLIGSTAYMPEQYGEQLVRLARRILAGEAVPPAVYCQHVFISAENVDHYYPDPAQGEA